MRIKMLPIVKTLLIVIVVLFLVVAIRQALFGQGKPKAKPVQPQSTKIGYDQELYISGDNKVFATEFPFYFTNVAQLAKLGKIKGVPSKGDIACEVIVKTLRCINSESQVSTLEIK